ISAGQKSARSTPLLGLAFLISAITAAWPAAILARIAPTKSRGAAACSASARTAASGLRICASFTSCAFTARIFLRMSDIAAPAFKKGAHFNTLLAVKCARQFVGCVERSDTQQKAALYIDDDGYRYAQPILPVFLT